MSIVGQLGMDLLEINSRAENTRLSDSEGTSLIKASLEFLKKRDNGILDLLQNVIKNVENYQSIPLYPNIITI